MVKKLCWLVIRTVSYLDLTRLFTFGRIAQFGKNAFKSGKTVRFGINTFQSGKTVQFGKKISSGRTAQFGKKW